jgi:hypothetical protein
VDELLDELDDVFVDWVESELKSSHTWKTAHSLAVNVAHSPNVKVHQPR